MFPQESATCEASGLGTFDHVFGCVVGQRRLGSASWLYQTVAGKLQANGQFFSDRGYREAMKRNPSLGLKHCRFLEGIACSEYPEPRRSFNLRQL